MSRLLTHTKPQQNNLLLVEKRIYDEASIVEQHLAGGKFEKVCISKSKDFCLVNLFYLFS